MAILERLRKRLRVMPSGCWEWQGHRNKDGYGTIWKGTSMALTHRALWEEVNGPIPEGLLVLHTCDNPPCCNPEHLFLGTQADNNADMVAKGRHRPCPGEKSGGAKLTWEKVEAIRADTRINREIAAEYGVDTSTISIVKSGKEWNPKETG